MASELVKELVDSGIHFGHRASRWNPKMRDYIFGKRNLIHIIDIRETVKGLLLAKKFVSQMVSDGGDVLFVGTKRQARHAVEHYARSCEMPFVAERWLGGTLTNFRTIRSRLSRLEELEAEVDSGKLMEFSKKAIASRQRELRKIKRNLDGVRVMNKLPVALVVVDVEREHIAVREAKKLKIPTVCLIDTDSDPDFADIPIPGNDDAIRSIETVLKHIAEAVQTGKRARPTKREEPKEQQGAPSRRRSSRVTARADEPANPAADPAADAEVPAESAERRDGEATEATEATEAVAPAAKVESSAEPAGGDSSNPSEAPAGG